MLATERSTSATQLEHLHAQHLKDTESKLEEERQLWGAKHSNILEAATLEFERRHKDDVDARNISRAEEVAALEARLKAHYDEDIARRVSEMETSVASERDKAVAHTRTLMDNQIATLISNSQRALEEAKEDADKRIAELEALLASEREQQVASKEQANTNTREYEERMKHLNALLTLEREQRGDFESKMRTEKDEVEARITELEILVETAKTESTRMAAEIAQKEAEAHYSKDAEERRYEELKASFSTEREELTATMEARLREHETHAQARIAKAEERGLCEAHEAKMNVEEAQLRAEVQLEELNTRLTSMQEHKEFLESSMEKEKKQYEAQVAELEALLATERAAANEALEASMEKEKNQYESRVTELEAVLAAERVAATETLEASMEKEKSQHEARVAELESLLAAERVAATKALDAARVAELETALAVQQDSENSGTKEVLQANFIEEFEALKKSFADERETLKQRNLEAAVRVSELEKLLEEKTQTHKHIDENSCCGTRSHNNDDGSPRIMHPNELFIEKSRVQDAIDAATKELRSQLLSVQQEVATNRSEVVTQMIEIESMKQAEMEKKDEECARRLLELEQKIRDLTKTHESELARQNVTWLSKVSHMERSLVETKAEELDALSKVQEKKDAEWRDILLHMQEENARLVEEIATLKENLRRLQEQQEEA